MQCGLLPVMHRYDAYSSTSYSRGIRWLPSPEYAEWGSWVKNGTTFLSDNRYFEIHTEINVNSIKRYLVPFIQL